MFVGNTYFMTYGMGQKFSVKNAYAHPEYKGHGGFDYHDVGILRLDKTIKIGQEYNTQLIQLPSPNEETPIGREVWVQGWGTNPQNPGDPTLYRAKMAVTCPKACRRIDKETLDEFSQHEICTEPVKGKTCPGDSGTPAVDIETNKVIGLDSFSNGGGCDTLHPIVFVKIIDNLDFINGIMGQNNTKNSHNESCEDM